MTRTVVTPGSSGGLTAVPSLNNWASGTFGNGLVQIFGQAGTHTWTVPSGVSSVRVRVWGAGGAGGVAVAQSGGGGGGFAMGTVDLSGISSVTVTVGQGGLTTSAVPASGGTSSFGSYISATGGSAGVSSGIAAGGVGAGGVINHQGGSCVLSSSGGGGVANMFGNGNWGYSGSGNLYVGVAGYTGATAGAGGGYGASTTPTSMNGLQDGHSVGTFSSYGATPGGNFNLITPTLSINSLDMIGTGYGAYSSYSDGVNGGGGYGGNFATRGGWPGGGGGGSAVYGGAARNQGAGGLVIVEY